MTCSRTSRVRVLARVRPAFTQEEAVLATSVPESTVTVHVVPRKTPRKALLPTAAKHAPERQSYKFDHVLGQEATQADLCSAVDIPQKVASCVAGHANHSVVTAGGSGKTHTILGPNAMDTPSCETSADSRPSRQDGVLYSALQKGLLAAASPSSRSCEISVSVLEVYKERVMDLLQGKREVQVKHTAQLGFYAHGARKVVCRDFPKAANILRKALSHRIARAHDVNDNSSRSHAIVIVHFDTWAKEGTSEAGEAAKAEQLFSVISKAREAHGGPATTTGESVAGSSAEPQDAAHEQNVPGVGIYDESCTANTPEDDCSAQMHVDSGARPGRRKLRKYGQFIFVDLAGSERLKATGTQGPDGVSESCAINRSLFALGRVLNAVSETSQGRQQQVPYRDSVLTKLLANSLQQAAQITMIACLHPLSAHIGQSTSTLQFAKAALSIKTKPVERVNPHDKMVMDLKEVVSRLRKENQSLTNAFLWLCSGNADWQTLVQTLPENLFEQLPSSAPRLLTGSQTAPANSASGSASGSMKAVDVQHSLPPTPEMPGTPALPVCPEASRMWNRSLQGKMRPKSRCKSRTGSGRPASRQADERPSSRCSSTADGVTHRFLEQFPELAALESEFQHLVCRPATGEESLEAHAAKQPPSQPLQDEPVSETPRPCVQPPPGIDLSPKVLRDVLMGVAEGLGDALAPGSAGELHSNANGHLENAGADMPLPAAPAIESDAVLWASHNLWFGVEEDMTAAAYKVHDELQVEGTEPCAEYFNRISAAVRKLFPEKWAEYSEMGATLNTMSKQQGIMNTPVTLEVALSNRASWTKLRRKQCSSVRVLPRPGGTCESSQSITPVSQRPDATRTPPMDWNWAKSHEVHDSKSSGAGHSRRDSRSSARATGLTPRRSKSSQQGAFSQERCKTPGEQMRDRLSAKLGISAVPCDASDSDTIRASWDCIGASWQSVQPPKKATATQATDRALHKYEAAATVQVKGRRERRPWNTSPRTMDSGVGEVVGASTLGMSSILDVDSLASQYIQQSSGRQRSLMEAVARHAAIMADDRL